MKSLRVVLPGVLGVCAACGQDNLVGVKNNPPEVSITSHGDGDLVREGVVETVTASVNDIQDDAEELVLEWQVNGEVVCVGAVASSAGNASCEMVFVEPESRVSIKVTDIFGSNATDSVDLVVQPTDAPTASIEQPVADGVYYSDLLTTLQGTVGDTEDAPEDLIVTWSSNLDGELSGDFTVPDTSGALLGATTLSAGEHFLTLMVEDSTGKSTRDSVTVQVGPPNSAPTCAITSPSEDGTVYLFGETVDFTAEVADVDVPSDWLSVSWSSDKDGELGTSVPETDGSVALSFGGLSADTHQITLSVEDELGETCRTSVQVVVSTPPSLTVTAPSDGTVVNEGDTVQLAVSVSDGEDTPDAISVEWESSLDGSVANPTPSSTGDAEAYLDDLSAGLHVLTVTATDSAGHTAQDSVELTVNAVPTQPTVSLSPDPADTTDDLTASAAGSVDPDGSGVVTYHYAWYVDGVLSSVTTSAVFPAASTKKGSTYRVVVTPTDGTGSGTPGEAELVVSNAAPSGSIGGLSPSTLYTNDTLTASATFSDADGDSVTVTYDWSVNGVVVQSGTSATLDGSVHFDKDDVVSVEATGTDGTDATTVSSASVTVLNTAPSAPTLSIEPETPDPGDDLLCVVDVDSTDEDGDAITYVMSWTVDGVAFGSGASADSGLDSGSTSSSGLSTTTWPGDTIDGAEVADEETWVCTATPNDGDDDGTSASVSVETNCIIGSGATCPGVSCEDILDGGGSVGDGVYWIDPTDSGSAFEVDCLMDSSHDGGGWTGVFDDDYAVDGCPSAWTRVSSAGACSRGTVTGSTSLSVAVDTFGIAYSEVMGEGTMEQVGTLDAFHGSGDATSTRNLEDVYVDGLVITHGGSGSRDHIFTYAIGNTSGGYSAYDCPGDGGISPPSFVGSDYLCDTGNSSTRLGYSHYNVTLFGGDDWQVNLSGTTTDDLELRLMADQGTSDEEVYVTSLALWIR